MAEIGLLASIAGLATTAFEFSRTIFDLVQAHKDYPEAVQDLAYSTSALGQVLQQIEQRGKSAAKSTPFRKALELRESTFAAAVGGCQRDLERLKLVLVRLKRTGSQNLWRKIRSTVKYLYLERQIESVRRALEAHKSLLNILLALSIEEPISSLPGLREDTGRILQLLEVHSKRVDEVERESEATFKAAEEQLEEPTSEELEIGRLNLNDDEGLPKDQAASQSVSSENSVSTTISPPTLDRAEFTTSPSDMRTGAETHAGATLELSEKVTHMDTAPEKPAPRIQTPELVKALVTASNYGFTDTVELLLETGVDINAYDGESNALSGATTWRKANTVELLLNKGANPNLRRKDGVSPLVLAIKDNRIDIVRLLLEHGAAVKEKPFHRNSHSPLVAAAGQHNIDMVRLLLAHEADATEPGLLYRSMFGLDEELLDCLIDAGASFRELYDGQPLLCTAVESNKFGIVENLLRRGLDPTVQGKAPYSPLVLAVRNNRNDMVQLLLKYGGRKS